MNYSFADKVVLVTGAGEGIGRVTALAFAQAGAEVVLADRNQVSGETALSDIRRAGSTSASFELCDVSDKGDVDRLFATIRERYGRLDVAINNAGVEGELDSIDQQHTSNFDRVMSINLRGTFMCLREEVRFMKSQGSGVVINIASIAGHVGFPGTSVYTASKHAILGLTKAVALETARDGIRVCAISPGAVDTDMTNRFTGRKEENKEAMIAGIPLGRMCAPEEIARGALFLASDDAALFVGQTLNLDGGWAHVKP